jgi:HK97 gp10 family phage protein
MPLRFNAEAIWSGITGRIVAGLNATAEEAASIARDKAPVRKTFRGSVGRATGQSSVEAAAESALRRTLGLGPGPVRVQRTAAAPVHSTMRFRQIIGPGRLAPGGPELTARGRNELRSGRANFTSPSGTTLGGRLRGEIHTVLAEGGGSRWIAKVVSPTAYAKYVEFGTRHARAQPYLRPALSQVRESFRTRMRAAIA